MSGGPSLFDAVMGPGTIFLMVVGGIAVVVGAIMLYNARMRPPERRGALTGLGWTAIGCGGFLLMTPLLMIATLVVVFGGVVAYCEGSTAC